MYWKETKIKVQIYPKYSFTASTSDDYIKKPFSSSELVARVKAHIARYERLSGNMIKQQVI
ncbi:hypothetical protein CN679_18675 [Bacillus pseudomycoides]|nr:hypothetical protein CN679_18675 [Bacillus pseudomycoides]